MDDIDTESVNYFVNTAVEAKRLNPKTKQESIEAVLRKLKLINGEGKITFAALMLFGKDIEEHCLM